jgi:hypothetical protein
MHPKRVDIARVSAVVVAAVRASGSLLLGHLFPIVEVMSSLPAAARELGLRSSK